MHDNKREDTTALPVNRRPDVHREGTGHRMKDPSDRDHSLERERTERGNRGAEEEPGFGQGV